MQTQLNDAQIRTWLLDHIDERWRDVWVAHPLEDLLELVARLRRQQQQQQPGKDPL